MQQRWGKFVSVEDCHPQVNSSAKADEVSSKRDKDARELWVHEDNITLLIKLKNFFEENGKRASRRKAEPLEDLTNWIYSNWKSKE